MFTSAFLGRALVTDLRIFCPSSQGHKGRFGHEFLEFEFRPDGKLRYANNSNYKKDTCIRKEMTVSPQVLEEVSKIIQQSEVMKEDDSNWPEPDREGRQELEIVYGDEHTSFTTSKIGSLLDVQNSRILTDLETSTTWFRI